MTMRSRAVLPLGSLRNPLLLAVVAQAVVVAAWAQEAPPPVVGGARSASEHGFLANELKRVDPGQDGWDTEVFHDAIKPLLYEFVTACGNPQQRETATMAAAVHARFKSTPLRPANLRDRPLQGGFVVRRPTQALGAGESAANLTTLKPAVEAWLSPYATGQDVEIHAKIFRVTLDGLQGTATAYIDATGPAAQGGRLQQNATWRTHWQRPSADGEDWKLSGITLTAFEEVAFLGDQALFSDQTESVLAANDAWNSQLRYGIDHWRLRLETALDIEPAGINGLAIGDVNGDGLEDLFYTDSGGLPKRLFLHQPDGTLKDATVQAGLDYLDRSRAALFVDLDNDGDQDLAMALEDRVLILSNDGSGKFIERAALSAAPRVHGLAAADYDRDGRVDLYACSYGNDFSTFGEEGVPTPWFDANNGAPNALYRNDGQWRFSDVTTAVGLAKGNQRFSFAACWDDYDRDGWLDLYVANDFGRNNLYQNRRGTFVDVAAKAQAEDMSLGMAVSWGDLNGDGYMDLHISNMFSGAGNRITFQPGYKSQSQRSVVGLYQRFARGNTMLINRRNGQFADHSVASGITLGRWAWGNQLADVNNDGHLDSLVGNGLITGPEEDDL